MPPRAIDWSQLWYPGRKQPFSDDELARAGRDAPSPTLLAVMAVNVALLAFAVLVVSPPGQTGQLTGMLMGITVITTALGARLWRNPWRRPLMWSTFGLALAMVAYALLLRWRLPERTDREAMMLLLAVASGYAPVLLWFLTVWRAAQIEARLREQAEREKAVEMARRLATAQLEPHFLFNTLASVQHWVQTKDDRAAPLLAALTGYLRATLPLFNRPLLPLGDELAAVRQYVQVMQLRMGSRLAWHEEVPTALLATALPPGVLLTLVENAVVHGLEPAIDGGRLTLRARAAQGHVLIDVHDNGTGAPAGFSEGVGLANVRERLRLAFGGRASLLLHAPATGGFQAQLQLPSVPTP